MSLFNVVLVEPEIPNNTGNIGRTCVGADSSLHLVEPLGFEINDKQLRRAGLDYWPHLDWHRHQNWQVFESQVTNPERMIYFTTKTDNVYWDFEFQPGDWLIFGKETKGLDPALYQRDDAQALTLPMIGEIRSQNLSNAVAVVLYEALRQNRAKLGPKPL